MKNVGEGEFDALLAYSPAWYNRHRSINDYRHIQAATLVWEVPYGHGRHFGGDSNKFVNAILGGWQASIYERARSGQPLIISNSNSNLGNGQSSRANLVANPNISNPTANRMVQSGRLRSSLALYIWKFKCRRCEWARLFQRRHSAHEACLSEGGPLLRVSMGSIQRYQPNKLDHKTPYPKR